MIIKGYSKGSQKSEKNVLKRDTFNYQIILQRINLFFKIVNKNEDSF